MCNSTTLSHTIHTLTHTGYVLVSRRDPLPSTAPDTGACTCALLPAGDSLEGDASSSSEPGSVDAPPLGLGWNDSAAAPSSPST